MDFKKIIIIFFILISLSFIHAEASACPEGTEGGICITCSGTACMNQPNQDICKGKYVDDYFGWSLWLGGSSPCECYCPFSTYQTYYQNKCPACPATKCSGNYLMNSGKCDWTTQGECQYYGSTRCENGCDPVTNTCIAATPETPDLCAGKTCSQAKCEGGILKTYGKCDSSTGDCVYSNSTTCSNGCNSTTLDCNPDSEPDKEVEITSPPNPCLGVTCQNSCGPGVGEKAFPVLKYNGVCNSNLSWSGTDLCEYETKNCSACSPNGKDCVEVCDNGKKDTISSEKIDCASPDCSDSPACKCLTSSNGSNWITMGEKATPTGQINVIIIGTGYGNVNELERDQIFLKQAASVIKGFTSVEPYRSNLSKFKFYATRTNVYSGIQGLYSAQVQGMQKCNSSSTDQYIILHGDSDFYDGGRADICGNLADIYKTNAMTSTTLELYAMHEFGHSFGCLWDEYNTHYDDYASALSVDLNEQKRNDVYMAQLKKAHDANDLADVARLKELRMKKANEDISVPWALSSYRKAWQWMIHGKYYTLTNCSTQLDITRADCVQDFTSILSNKSWFKGPVKCYAECTAPYWFRSTDDDSIMRDVQDGGWDLFISTNGTPTYSPTSRAYLESKLNGTKIARWVNPKDIPIINEINNTGAGGALPSEWEK